MDWRTFSFAVVTLLRENEQAPPKPERPLQDGGNAFIAGSGIFLIQCQGGVGSVPSPPPCGTGSPAASADRGRHDEGDYSAPRSYSERAQVRRARAHLISQDS